MVQISPVTRALVPVDAAAAGQISAPNYDEFQSDREVWDLLQEKPESVLRVTMPHCHVASADAIGEDGSAEALEHAGEQMRALIESTLTRTLPGVLWVYEIRSPKRPDAPQIGLGGYARTIDIRTDKNPGGNIIRNEGIRQEKADGRSRLIKATGSYIGTVNLAVRDAENQLLPALEAVTADRGCDYQATDEAGNVHSVWLVTDPDQVAKFSGLMDQEPAAYVADGNHRSAAAADLGLEHFLAVFFPTSRLGLEPYNRLLPDTGVDADQFFESLSSQFDVEPLGDVDAFRPAAVHEMGLYTDGKWYRLTPRDGSYDAQDAAQAIDADIVQRHIIDGILGISDARDKRINYVGGNKDAAWLKSRVDAGDFRYAVSLAPVTMDQFVAVCEQNRFMPPKSTWFAPKIRSGLVIAILD
ncbi:hypothetical protein Mal4_28150 [Maioricimonas rarisocia]|uniref:DUF1015 domain-containing protein n=1 Tax=Maioricimonas rarisocia TaxID=2528026 RepID=A0A517Z7M6_9PLAN|nr:DUF1015 family protein [Maioricimonas rarisocia]QDU38487.1 hypothetical protein Mal4_28150 [Maioricimonas rarisocia]